MGAGRVAVDAQCFYCGCFAANGELAGAEGGTGGAVVVAAGLLRQAGAVVKAAVAGAVGKGLAQFGVLEGGVVGVLPRAVAAVVLPLLMDRISRIKYSSMAACRRWLDEAFHGCRTITNAWHNLQHRSNC